MQHPYSLKHIDSFSCNVMRFLNVFIAINNSGLCLAIRGSRRWHLLPLRPWRRLILRPFDSQMQMSPSVNARVRLGLVHTSNNVERFHCKISSFRQSRTKLNMFNLFRLCRKDEISFDIVAESGNIVAKIIIIIITKQGDLRLAPTSPVQTKIQLK